MVILGIIIALGAAAAFAVVAGLLAWGGWVSVRREVLRGFVSTAPSAGERALTLTLIALPLFGAALLSLLAAGKIAMVAFGI